MTLRLSSKEYVALVLQRDLEQDRDPNQSAVSIDTVLSLRAKGLVEACGPYVLIKSRREVRSKITDKGHDALCIDFNARNERALASYRARYG